MGRSGLGFGLLAGLAVSRSPSWRRWCLAPDRHGFLARLTTVTHSPEPGLHDRGELMAGLRSSGRCWCVLEGGDELIESAERSGDAEVVGVVAGADDLSVSDADHEDAGQRERLAGTGNGAPVLGLGHDDLRVRGLVDGDVGRLGTHITVPRARLGDMLIQLFAGADRMRPR